MQEEAQGIVDRLKQAGVTTEPDREIVALISYLQRLGKDGRAAIAAQQAAAAATPAPAGTP
jgi:hypothetical protein